MPFCRIVLVFLAASCVHGVAVSAAESRPNVVLVMTDDQGYGDLACHGNKQIKTPALDQLYADSVRLTNFHVDPTCSPTRSALMTGRYSSRTGVWHTIMGRSIMHPDEVTIAEVFSKGGYKTGCFGKWHLGDNFPCRPQDQGFDEVLVHGGGGVTQTPDYWGNDYFDDTYWHNGQTKSFKGYCTDVFFDGAMNFIEANRNKPFFCYIPTNAAHGPFLVAKKYSEPYKKMGIPSPRAEFYGMITNIDENMARLRKKLQSLGLEENTILIFMTDNGTAAGMRKGGFNAGMRGTKGSEFDGGHRVPFFIHWPKGKLTGGRDVGNITAHIDVLPTLAGMCGVKVSHADKLDGMNLTPLLSRTTKVQWPARTLAVHSQRVETPQKWRKAAVMTDRWRFISNGPRRLLFDMKADPGQKTDVSKQHPDVFRKLSAAYEKWYAHVGERYDGVVRIGLGSPKENPARLTCHDWHTNNKSVPWNQGHIKRDLRANGYWAVDVTRAGTYEITLRIRPQGASGAELRAGTARLSIGDVTMRKDIPDRATAITFKVELKSGPARFQTWLKENNGRERGAYFADVRFVK